MSNKIQILRSSTFGSRPSVGVQPAGVPYVNFADKQFGVVDGSGTPQDLIGVPMFSIAANYNVGNPINRQGILYCAKVTMAAGAWDATKWAQVLSTANLGQTGATIPVLNTQCTWTGLQFFSGGLMCYNFSSIPNSGILYLGQAGSTYLLFDSASGALIYNSTVRHQFSQAITAAQFSTFYGGLETAGPTAQSRVRGLSGSYTPLDFNMNSSGADGFSSISNAGSSQLSLLWWDGTTSAPAWTAVSDARLKQNIKDLDPEITAALFDGVRPREYDFTLTDQHCRGLIAQELESVAPEMIVRGDEDDEKLGTPDFKSHKLLYTNWIPDLIAEVHFMRKRMAKQEKELESLREHVATLEGQNP